MTRVEELKERVNRKHAKNYNSVRKMLREGHTVSGQDFPPATIADLEELLERWKPEMPAFGEIVFVVETEWSDEISYPCPFDDIPTWIRAIRDELSERYAREAFIRKSGTILKKFLVSGNYFRTSEIFGRSIGYFGGSYQPSDWSAKRILSPCDRMIAKCPCPVRSGSLTGLFFLENPVDRISQSF